MNRGDARAMRFAAEAQRTRRNSRREIPEIEVSKRRRSTIIEEAGFPWTFSVSSAPLRLV